MPILPSLAHLYEACVWVDVREVNSSPCFLLFSWQHYQNGPLPVIQTRPMTVKIVLKNAKETEGIRFMPHEYEYSYVSVGERRPTF